jgi:hypothetical protein
MMTGGQVQAELTNLARRLAPGLVEAAAQEARERARQLLVERLAAEIVTVALEQPRQPEQLRQPQQSDRPDQPGWPGRSGSATPEDESGRGLYVYGVVRADADTEGVAGLDGHTPVLLIQPSDSAEGGTGGEGDRGYGQDAPVALAASEIDLALLAGAEEDLSESGRLATLARRHDSVLRELLERSDAVVPLRFGTVLASVADGRRLLSTDQGALSEELGGVRGRREWGLRVDAAEEEPETPVPAVDAEAEAEAYADAGAAEGAEGTGPLRGTAYLTGRRDDLRAARRRQRARVEAARRADALLAEHAVDVAPRRGGPANRIFDCAYLVAVEAEPEFLAAAATVTADIEQAGCQAVVTGPWPPYSFSRITLGAAGEPNGERGAGGGNA